MAIRAAAASAEVALEQLSLEDDAVLAGDHFAGQQAGDDLGQLAVLDAGAHAANVKELGAVLVVIVLVADENDVTASVPMHGVAGDDNHLVFLAEDDPPSAKSP